MSSAAGVRTSVAARVATIELARPERRNAVTPAMQRAYLEALRDADDDPAVRAIVVTGQGSAFCAGADMGELDALAARGDAHDEELAISLPTTLRCPVIAAVNGPAIGIGFVYAAYADVRFAAESAVFAGPYARLGLVAEYGLSWLLPRLVSAGAALDLLLSGRMVGAEEALRIGLVQRVLPDGELLEAATAYAGELAEGCSPRSLAIIKRQVYDDLGAPFASAYDESCRLLGEAFAGADIDEGLAAFAEKRAPEFTAERPPRRP